MTVKPGEDERGSYLAGSPVRGPSRRSDCSEARYSRRSRRPGSSRVGRPAEIQPDGVPLDDVAGGRGPKSWIPTEPLPEIRLPAPAVVPPIVLFGASLTKTPSSPFGIAPFPPHRCRSGCPHLVARGRRAGDLDADDPIARDQVLCTVCCPEPD